MEHSINIEDDSQDEFDSEGKNVGKVMVVDSEGTDITSGSRVILELSEDALLGLGTELIRLSKRYEDGIHFHICPSEEKFLSQSMGIFLTPGSCEFIIGCRDFGQIDNHFEAD